MIICDFPLSVAAPSRRSHFHKNRLISTKIARKYMCASCLFASIFRINGGAILQKERADKSHRRTGNGTRKRSGKGTPGEPEAEPARDPGKELRKRISNEVRKRTGNGTRKSNGDENRKGIRTETRKGIGNETHAALGKPTPQRMARESSYGEWNDGKVRETRAPLVGPGRF
jgi:hypothetical protein